ncbi:MAG TPA: hypothetical protein VK348_01495 [Planctomycetota bacterium]|nr:hypothetical protein [Planctomycetota bacterium]
MRSLASIVRLLCVFAAVLGAMCAQTLQFADGQVLMVNIDDVDGNGLRVHRLDNGGQLELRWEHLSPDCALRLKQAYSLVGSAEEDATVAADLVTYEKDGIKQEVLGKIDDAAGTPTELVVRKKGVQYRVAKADLKGVKKVQAPVGQVFTRDEYYADLLTTMPPGDDGDKHVNLAQELIKVRDYDHAGDHLAKAKELKTRDPNRLQQMTEKLARYKDSAKERSLLDQIQFARQRGTGPEFDNGLKLIAQWEKDYPTSKLRSEFDTEKKRFVEARTKYLAQLVAEKWRQLIQAVADKKAGETGVTLQSVKEYATGKMKDDVAARVADQVKLPVDEVKQLFADRGKYPLGKRPEFFAYGIGSWTLGDKAILKDTKQGQAPANKTDKDPAQEREIERLAKLIRQAMERSRAAAKNQQGGAPKEATEEDWWREATRNEKTSFLRAYYAEFGGDLKVTIAYLQPCIACYGEGTVTELGGDGKVQKVNCYLCHKTKWLRSFRAY